METPYPLSAREWRELAGHPDVAKACLLDRDPVRGAEQLKDMTLAVKFDFVTLAPAYIGDLFILHPKMFKQPMVFMRDKRGRLVWVHEIQ